MLSKTKVKYIRSLELKKFRNENNVFVAEGNKLVADMLPAFECELLIAKPSWMATQGDIAHSFYHSGERTIGSGRRRHP